MYAFVYKLGPSIHWTSNYGTRQVLYLLEYVVVAEFS